MDLQTCSESSQTLVERIEQYVQSRTGGMIRGLHVEIVGDDVFVSGRTSTYYNKQLATHAVLAAVQGINLTNDIEVC
jgi:hypothetical protein